MEDHDVIVECAKYVLEASRDDLGFLSSTITLRSHSTMELALALGKGLKCHLLFIQQCVNVLF